MTLTRAHSFKIQSSNQFKLKTNFKSKSSTVIQCQQSVDVPIDHTENAANKNILCKNLPTIQDQTAFETEINSNKFHSTTNSMPIAENRIQSTELLSMAPNIETNNKKIRLTIAPMHVHSRRTHTHSHTHPCYNKLRRSTAQPILRSWFGWFRPKKNAAFYSPPLEHPVKRIKIDIHPNDNPNGLHTVVSADSASSNDDEEISNSSLQNVDQAAIKDELDELAAYMDEIRAREKR